MDQAKQILAETASTAGTAPEKALSEALAQIVAFHANPAAAPAAQAAAATLARSSPDHPAAKLVSAMIAAARDPRAARAQFEQLAQSHPDFLLAQRELALLLEETNDDAAAAALLNKLRVALPNDPELAFAQGKIAYRRQDYREAARLLRQAAPAFPKNADLQFYLGMAQFHAKEKAAKETLTAALILKPDAPLAADARKALAELK